MDFSAEINCHHTQTRCSKTSLQRNQAHMRYPHLLLGSHPPKKVANPSFWPPTVSRLGSVSACHVAHAFKFSNSNIAFTLSRSLTATHLLPTCNALTGASSSRYHKLVQAGILRRGYVEGCQSFVLEQLPLLPPNR